MSEEKIRTNEECESLSPEEQEAVAGGTAEASSKKSFREESSKSPT
jgi:hypothetical protein